MLNIYRNIFCHVNVSYVKVCDNDCAKMMSQGDNATALTIVFSRRGKKLGQESQFFNLMLLRIKL